MSGAITLAIIGAGNRGMEVYGELALRLPGEAKVVAVVEPDDYKRDELARRHGIPASHAFRGLHEFLSAGRLADVAVVTGPDPTHFESAVVALEQGYHLLLEKPVATSAERLRELRAIAEGRPESIVVVCHVLRYAPFYAAVKRVLDSGELGDLIAMEHSESIGYYHFAHSYVRGNWRRSDESSPLVLAKSCHDMDIMRYLAGAPCSSIAAVGGLAHFSRAFAPPYAAERCSRCDAKAYCAFSAYRIYTDPTTWPGSIAAPTKTLAELELALAEGPYGRCVYHCDNDAIDHLSASLSFANGVTAAFSLCAFTAAITRKTRLMCTKGELLGDMQGNRIEVSIFGRGKAVIEPEPVAGGHGGGDARLFEDFLTCVRCGRSSRSSLSLSLESHFMALAAEESRIKGVTIRLAGP